MYCYPASVWHFKEPFCLIAYSSSLAVTTWTCNQDFLGYSQVLSLLVSGVQGGPVPGRGVRTQQKYTDNLQARYLFLSKFQWLFIFSYCIALYPAFLYSSYTGFCNILEPSYMLFYILRYRVL
uniref:Uncharacterized protein n=1 Tax=Pipistrellus kuhlii TaxID=59472 RepID=A0A7J7V0N6_PIPKU|nr:hypothetical protein mPipKuh1_008647 [Pipistrellus kuhlii]